MAKQLGIHQLKGKVRDMSYYRQKGVVDGLARSINQGLSKRVKEDAAYQNTRLNAAEFGTVGSFAGAAIRAISDRQRAMLKDFATGDLAKVCRALIQRDTGNPWGARRFSKSSDEKFIVSTINTYAKNDFVSYVGGVWDVEITDNGSDYTWSPNAELPEGWGAPFSVKGATGAYVDMYAYLVHMSPSGNGSARSISDVTLIGSDDFSIGQAGTIVTPTNVGASFDPADSDNILVETLVVVRPYKEVNSTKYVMQELCTFSLFTPSLKS